jgi:hydrogenase-4 component E
MNTQVIETLSMTLVLTSLAAVELRKLSSAAVAYVLQALLIVALLASFATVNPALYWWAGTALVTKAILVPWCLFWAIGRTGPREVKPLMGLGPSILVAVALTVGFLKLTHRYAGLLAQAALAQQAVFQTNLTIAATVFVLGLYCLLTRRDAVKAVIGLCLLENGVHLSLVTLAPDLPETTLFGIASEVVVVVFLLLYVIVGVKQAFGTTNTAELRELRG